MPAADAQHLCPVASGAQGAAPRDGHHATVAVHDGRNRQGHTGGWIGEHIGDGQMRINIISICIKAPFIFLRMPVVQLCV